MAWCQRGSVTLRGSAGAKGCVTTPSTGVTHTGGHLGGVTHPEGPGGHSGGVTPLAQTLGDMWGVSHPWPKPREVPAQLSPRNTEVRAGPRGDTWHCHPSAPSRVPHGTRSPRTRCQR